MFTDKTRLEKVPTPLNFTRISKSCLKKSATSEFQEKQEEIIPHEINPIA